MESALAESRAGLDLVADDIAEYLRNLAKTGQMKEARRFIAEHLLTEPETIRRAGELIEHREKNEGWLVHSGSIRLTRSPRDVLERKLQRRAMAEKARRERKLQNGHARRFW